MTGAECLVRGAREMGVEVCFANPGTTEMPLVAALDREPGLRAVLGLFEGVCTGAADGYGRMGGRPAATLLHLGPGLANGLANLHNARRARTPVLNWIGDHATWHRSADAPLTSDIAALAASVGWVREVRRAEDLAGDGAAAWLAAASPPGRVASLVIPADCQWGDAGRAAEPPRLPAALPPDERALAEAASALDRRAVLLLGGRALGRRGLAAAARLAARGCRVFVETFPARQERGAGVPDFERLPYFPEQACPALAGCTDLLLAGAGDPVAFFGYPGQPSRLAPEAARRIALAGPEVDAETALEALAERVSCPPLSPRPPQDRPEPAQGPLTPGSLGQTLAALQPEGAIVVDESATSGRAWLALSATAPPHTTLALTGGAIGQGLPCATGAAVACPDRRVVAFQADGGALYTIQALWTQAREALDVVTVICSNRSYRILQVELARAGVAEPGPQARSLTQLDAPAMDWVAMARAFGVPAQRAETAEGLAKALQQAFAEPGPSLIEAVLG